MEIHIWHALTSMLETRAGQITTILIYTLETEFSFILLRLLLIKLDSPAGISLNVLPAGIILLHCTCGRSMGVDSYITW